MAESTTRQCHLPAARRDYSTRSSVYFDASLVVSSTTEREPCIRLSRCYNTGKQLCTPGMIRMQCYWNQVAGIKAATALGVQWLTKRGWSHGVIFPGCIQYFDTVDGWQKGHLSRNLFHLFPKFLFLNKQQKEIKWLGFLCHTVH